MKKKRIKWLDVAKAISIILVVLGHSGHAYLDVYLGWFRIPLFFFLSGILFKPVETQKLVKWSLVKTKKMMIPYFLYGLLILAVLSLYKDYDIFITIGDLLYGGRELGGAHGVFWFITVLLLTQLLFGVISGFKKSTQFILVLLLFFIGHIPLLSNYNFLWNADVVLVSLFYYSMGYFSKSLILKYSNSILLVLLSASLSITFVFLNVSGNIDYYMNMKMSRFNNVILDIIIPFSFFIPIIFVSQLISHTKARVLFEFIGKYSIVIMYLHLPINILINEIFTVTLTPLNFTLAGVLIPVLIGFTFSKFSFTRKVMLGIS